MLTKILLKFSFTRWGYVNFVKKIHSILLSTDEVERKQKMIISVYNALLHREPEPGAVEYWLAYLQKGNSTDDLLKKFIDSEEFQGVKETNQNRFFVPPGHFYSPIVDTKKVKKLFDITSSFEDLPGIKIDKNMMLELWRELHPYVTTTPFSENKINTHRYYFLNPAFSFSDGIILSAMLRHFKPMKIIEIGSGYSSACTLDTIDKHLGYDVDVIFIEPYPELLKSLIGGTKFANINLVEDEVQEVDLKLFSCLKENDVLFIDSTHLIKTGSDVCYELFEILPSLKSGVLIHFHDIFWPFEYPKDWVVSENRSWNEIYGLRAFLMNNVDYEIIFFNDYFCKYFKNTVEQDCPQMLKNTGGSLWLRKK